MAGSSKFQGHKPMKNTLCSAARRAPARIDGTPGNQLGRPGSRVIGDLGGGFRAGFDFGIRHPF